MEHLKLDGGMTLDLEYQRQLIDQWLNSSNEESFIEWLEILVHHYCLGGASNQHIFMLRKTITVLVHNYGSPQLTLVKSDYKKIFS
jgi:hypothetical protein